MSTLATALAALGGVVLAGVLGHGVWQAKRAGPKKAEPVDRQEPGTPPPVAAPAPSPYASPAAARPEPALHEPREPVLGDSAGVGAGSPSGFGGLPPSDPALFAKDVNDTLLAIGAGGPTGGLGLGAGGVGPAMTAFDDSPVNPSTPAAPTLSADGLDAPENDGPADASAPPQFVPSEPFIDVKPAPRRAVPRLDALIDALATLKLDAPISGEMALQHLPPSRRAGSKPFLVEGLNASNGEWEHPAPGQRYGEMQAGVQLANRTGALNEIEYSEFVHKVQSFAESIGAMVDFPDMLDVVGRARELDAFAGQHDAQLAVHLRARDVAWSVGYVHQHAARHGFAIGGVPGRMVLPAAQEGAPPVLTLAFDPQAALADDPSQAAVRDLTLSFDVPQSDASADPFTSWVKSAQTLAKDMDAVIVDDNGHPLHPESFTAIGNELGKLYEALAGRDVAAGSMAARRLFS